MRKIDSIQALRAMAAILVLLYHTQVIFTTVSMITPFNNTFANGDKGVDLFFVLSGFIMAYVHFDDIGHPRRVGAYIYSRLTRVYPLVWIMSAAALIVYLSGFNHGKDAKLELIHLVQSVLLLPQDGPALVNVTWTLKYEMFFYLLFGLTIVHRHFGFFVLALWQCSILVLMAFNIDTSALWAFYLRPIELEFGIGIVVAALILRTPHQLRFCGVIGACILVVGVASFTAFFLFNDGFHREFTFGLAGACIVAGCCLVEMAGKLKIPRPILLLGDASYAIYLAHFSVITLLATLVRRRITDPNDFVCATVALCALIVGVFFYLTTDRPISRFARRVKQRYIDRVCANASS